MRLIQLLSGGWQQTTQQKQETKPISSLCNLLHEISKTQLSVKVGGGFKYFWLSTKRKDKV